MTIDKIDPQAPIAFWKRCALLALVIAYWVGWVTLTHWPKISLPPLGNLRIDKLMHFCGYCALAFLLSLLPSIVKGVESRPTLRQALGIFAAIAVGGILDELTQPAFGRSFEWGDYIADLLGGATGLALFYVCFAMRQRQQQQSKASAAPRPTSR